MGNLPKLHLCLIVVFLAIQCCSASFLRTWTFVKNNETAANGIVCRGAYCDDLRVVSCSGLYFDIDYSCNTPDLNPDSFDTSFTILCYRNVYRNENCYVEVHATKKLINQVGERPPSILKLTIYLMLVQILVGAFVGIPLYFSLKLKEKS